MHSRVVAIAIRCLALSMGLLMSGQAIGQFDIVFEFTDIDQFDSESVDQLNLALVEAEQLWEGIILGHQGSDEPVVFSIALGPTSDGVALGGPADSEVVGDFILPTAGAVYVNPDWVIRATEGFVPAAAGVNLLDELLVHEIGHALGFGELWEENGAYVDGSGQYTGTHGLAAFREEFDADATFIPVELAGGEGTANGHWDQLMRSSAEGDVQNPWVLSPLIGIVDSRGRDLGQELMTGALDPDYGVPFLSNTTVQSLRDLGYEVIEQFPLPADRNSDGVRTPEDLDHMGAMIRDQSDDLFYDVNSDGFVSTADHAALIGLLGTVPGDSNFDGHFDSADFVVAFQAGQYEDDVPLNSTWRVGDWTGDGEFNTADFIFAFQNGAYEKTPAAVPEPSTASIGILMLFLWTRSMRKRSEHGAS